MLVCVSLLFLKSITVLLLFILSRFKKQTKDYKYQTFEVRSLDGDGAFGEAIVGIKLLETVVVP